MTKMKPISPEREALASAIAAYDAAANEVDDAARASAITSRKMFDISDELAALRDAAQRREGDDGIDVAAILAGDDTAVLGRPIDRARERELETAMDQWRRASDDVAQKLAAAKNRLSIVRINRDNAAAAVLAADETVERLFDGFAELASEYAARRAAILAVADHAEPPRGNGIKVRLAHISQVDYERHPVVDDWKRAFAELKINPNSELPK
jgi:hypothetical protein